MKLKRNRALFLTALALPLLFPTSAFAAWLESPGVDSPLSDPVVLILAAIVAVSVIINICLLIWILRIRRQARRDMQYFFNQPVYNEEAIHDYAMMEASAEFKETSTEVFVSQQTAEPDANLSVQGLETGSEVDFFAQMVEAAPQMDYFAQTENHLHSAGVEDVSPEEYGANLSGAVQLLDALSAEEVSPEEHEIKPQADQMTGPIQQGGEAATRAQYLVQQDEAMDETLDETLDEIVDAAAETQEPEEFTLEMIRQVLVDLQQVQETTDESAIESTIPSELEVASTMTLESASPEGPLSTESMSPASISSEFETEAAGTNYYGRHF